MKIVVGFVLYLSTVVAGSSCEAAGASLEDLSTAANNSYFVKWHPQFHFQAPNSRQNGLSIQELSLCVDPNIGYTKRWFMGYQYHPAHINWGKIHV